MSERKTGSGIQASELRVGPAGLEFDEEGVAHLFAWPEILRRLGSAGSDLALNVEWGKGWLSDRIEWVDLLVFEDEIGVLEHGLLREGRPAGVLKALVEFEDDRIRLYYDESCGGEAGIVEILHVPGSRMSLREVRFLPFGAKVWTTAESFWFSGSLAY